jgi:hypothetical protein
LQWTLNNRQIANTTRRYQSGSNLVITSVNRTLDRGDLHCIATYLRTGIAKESQPAQLSILCELVGHRFWTSLLGIECFHLLSYMIQIGYELLLAQIGDI